MNSQDFEKLEALQELYNTNAISEIDLWNTVQSFPSLTARDKQNIQNRLYTLDAQKYNPHDPVNLPKPRSLKFEKADFVPKFQLELRQKGRSTPMYISSNPYIDSIKQVYYPQENMRVVDPKTNGDRMFMKLGYRQVVYDVEMLIFNEPLSKIFEKKFEDESKIISFEKKNGEISFRTFMSTVYGSKTPAEVTSLEFDAIIQIITEWKD